MKSLFEKIIDRELPAKILFEDDQLIVIEDKYPKAPVHLLLIPKKKIPDVQTMQEEDFPILGALISRAQEMAKELELDRAGYRLVINNGPHAGQTIFHLHLHLLGGGSLGGMG